MPTYAEWTTLTTYLDGGDVAGGKLKEIGTTHWQSPNKGATNETGFTALPGGYRKFNGSFDGVGSSGYWWSATEDCATFSWFRFMYYLDSDIYKGLSYKELEFPVRCVRD